MIIGAVVLVEVLCARSIWFLLKLVITTSSPSLDINWMQFSFLWYGIPATLIIHYDLIYYPNWLVCTFFDTCCSIRLLILLLSPEFSMDNFLLLCISLPILMFCSSNLCKIKSWLFSTSSEVFLVLSISCLLCNLWLSRFALMSLIRVFRLSSILVSFSSRASGFWSFSSNFYVLSVLSDIVLMLELYSPFISSFVL